MNQIAVLTGGSTPERDVAFAGAAQVVAALRQVGHTVTVVERINRWRYSAPAAREQRLGFRPDSPDHA